MASRDAAGYLSPDSLFKPLLTTNAETDAGKSPPHQNCGHQATAGAQNPAVSPPPLWVKMSPLHRSFLLSFIYLFILKILFV